MKNHKLKFIIQLVLIVLIALGLGITLVFYKCNLYVQVILVILLLIQIIRTIRFQTGFLEQVNYFFEAILNDDFTYVQRPVKKNDMLYQVKQNMGKVNQKIRLKMEENHQQEYYFRTLIEHLNIGILTFNTGGFVIHANKTLLRYFGMEHLSHIKQFLKQDPEIYKLILQLKDEHIQQVYNYNFESRQYNYLLKSTSYYNNKEPLTIITVQDIDQQLDEKELDSWIKLIRVLTHEIMNGIAPITSLSESIMDLYVTDKGRVSVEEISSKEVDTTIKGLTVINEQAERLIKFVESYRKITRLPKPVKAPIDLKSFLGKIILLSKAGSYFINVDVTLKILSERSELIADEKLLTQVFLNILKNSMEALNDTMEPAISIEVKSGGNNITEIVIENNGPQIPKELLNDIFVPFFTTKEYGSGVGLSISRQIIRLHGGAIKVSSTIEKTRFIMSFPN